MQVVSGPFGREWVHFEAPAAQRVPGEMARFIAWCNADTDEDPVLRAAIAHFWFVTIHPFEDGNGRLARALADLMLARADGCPERFSSMSTQIEAERKDYYRILERTQRGDLDITPWMLWFLGCLKRALVNAGTLVESVLHKATQWQASSAGSPVNDRQRLVINRLLETWTSTPVKGVMSRRWSPRGSRISPPGSTAGSPPWPRRCLRPIPPPIPIATASRGGASPPWRRPDEDGPRSSGW